MLGVAALLPGSRTVEGACELLSLMLEESGCDVLLHSDMIYWPNHLVQSGKVSCRNPFREGFACSNKVVRLFPTIQ